MVALAKKTKKKLPQPVRVRPDARFKFEQVAGVKGWKLIQVADAAIDALIATDPQLKSLRK